MVPLQMIEEERILQAIKSNLTMLGAVLPEKSLVRKNYRIFYLSSAITSGVRMYEYMTANRMTDPGAIKQSDLFSRIMTPNIEESIQTSHTIRKKGYPYVIVPGYFIAEGWTQEHYLDLWRKVIADFVHTVFFNEGWEYSNGCVAEFYLSVTLKKEVLNTKMKPIDPIKALALIRRAINDLEARGFNPTHLYDHYRKIDLFISRPGNLSEKYGLDGKGA